LIQNLIHSGDFEEERRENIKGFPRRHTYVGDTALRVRVRFACWLTCSSLRSFASRVSAAPASPLETHLTSPNRPSGQFARCSALHHSTGRKPNYWLTFRQSLNLFRASSEGRAQQPYGPGSLALTCFALRRSTGPSPCLQQPPTSFGLSCGAILLRDLSRRAARALTSHAIRRGSLLASYRRASFWE
jgi:hypothetical protein